MARNRKYQSAAIRFGPVLKAFLLCLLIGGSGVGYVWQKKQIYELSLQQRSRELELKALVNQNEMLKQQLAKLCSVGSLEARIKELNLGLVPTPPQQKWLLKLPVPGRPREAAGPEQALTLR